MSRYACRDDDCSLKIPPAGGRQAFCALCPNRPYKGENCLFGHDAETVRIINHVIVLRHICAAQRRAILLDRCCPVCGLLLRNMTATVHRECWARVVTRERENNNRGEEVPRAEVIRELRAEHENPV